MDIISSRLPTWETELQKAGATHPRSLEVVVRARAGAWDPSVEPGTSAECRVIAEPGTSAEYRVIAEPGTSEDCSHWWGSEAGVLEA